MCVLHAILWLVYGLVNSRKHWGHCTLDACLPGYLAVSAFLTLLCCLWLLSAHLCCLQDYPFFTDLQTGKKVAAARQPAMPQQGGPGSGAAAPAGV
jgi:hypothetical protein